MSNELTANRNGSSQPPLPVAAPRPPAEAADLQVDVLSTSPLVVARLRAEFLPPARPVGERGGTEAGR